MAMAMANIALIIHQIIQGMEDLEDLEEVNPQVNSHVKTANLLK